MNGNRLRFTGSGTVHCRNGTRMIWPAQSGTEGIRVQVSQASRLRNVTYDIRGPVLRRARQLEAEGHPIIKLNLGNPAPFGLFAPDDVLRDVIEAIPAAQGYSDARGIQDARVAVADSFARRGMTSV